MDKTINELKMLLNYLIGHNKEHAQEINELAQAVDKTGHKQAHDLLLQGVNELLASNTCLEKALDLLNKEA